MVRCFKIVLGLFAVMPVFAQEVPQRFQQQLEDVAEVMEEGQDDNNWLQQLEYYRKHPLCINTATDEDLRSLHLLNDLQIHNLLQYRSLLGRLVDVHELLAVPGWDAALIQRLIPYITVQDGTTLREALRMRVKEGDHVFLASNSRVLEHQKGNRETTSSRYLGSKDHLQFRYQYRYKNLLQLGMTGDKDPGEPFFSGVQTKGFDFYSFHLFARKLGVIKAVALGDFTVNLGQGLVHWQALAFGKSAEVINIKRQAAPLLPYSSAGEFYFNRGVGVTLQKGRVEVTAFGSYRKLSGNRAIDTSSGEEVITSLQTSGYHRTEPELIDRNHAGLLATGGALTLRYTIFRIGLNGVCHYLEKPLQKRDEAHYHYAISGKRWSNYSLDYSATFRNVHLYGEAAVDHRFSRAFVQGALISVHAKADVSLLYRNIGAAYQALSAKAFTENTTPTNEQGFYLGINLRPHPEYRIDGYADFYRFPWLKYRVNAPSAGRDYSLQLTYQPRRQVEVSARYRYEQKSRNGFDADSVLYAALPVARHNWSAHVTYQFNNQFEVRVRTDGVIYYPGTLEREDGYSAFVEGVYRRGSRFSCNLRLHGFSTDGYNSRIYAYENNLLYNYSVPSFFDRGMHYYLRINWDASQRLSLWLRWSQTFYKDKVSIGSGLEEIEGNRRSEVRVQMRLTI
jgi:hypothetical protein